MVVFVAFGIIAMIIVVQRIIYIKLAFANLIINYHFSQTEVNEEDIFYITETIENKKYLPLPAVSTILEIGAGLAFADGEGKAIEQKSVFCFYTVGICKKITRTWRVKAITRGRFNLSGITVNVRDIFGLVKVSKDFECNTSVLILPMAYNINQRLNSLNLTGGDRAVSNGYFSNPFEIQKIMPYTYSEPLNKINWKASAKSQNLMVNIEQPSIFERMTVILDVSEKFYLEKNIKLCATLKKILPEENEITFVSNGIMPEDCYNPLIKFKRQNDIDYIETHEFNLGAHERNFKRLLAEIMGNYSNYLNFSDDPFNAVISVEDIAEQALKNMFCSCVIIVKGGRIYDCESGQTIFI